MAAFQSGIARRLNTYGLKVEEPASVLPATGTANIFTVAGGKVIVTGLIGTCTTVCTATATTVSFGTAPTVGTASTTGLCTATAITSAEVGAMISLPAGAKGALVSGVTAGVGVQMAGDSGYVVQSGSITVTTSATNTGAFRYTLFYLPLDDGATVVAV